VPPLSQPTECRLGKRVVQWAPSGDPGGQLPCRKILFFLIILAFSPCFITSALDHDTHSAYLEWRQDGMFHYHCMRPSRSWHGFSATTVSQRRNAASCYRSVASSPSPPQNGDVISSVSSSQNSTVADHDCDIYMSFYPTETQSRQVEASCPPPA